MPFLAPKFHPAGRIKGPNEQKERNADSGHCYAEPLEVLIILWHIGHAINRLGIQVSVVVVL